MTEAKHQDVTDLLAVFHEATVQIFVDEDLDLHIFLIQPAPEQTLRLEVANEWLERHDSDAIRRKLEHYDMIGKLRTCGGVPGWIDRSTCP